VYLVGQIFEKSIEVRCVFAYNVLFHIFVEGVNELRKLCIKQKKKFTVSGTLVVHVVCCNSIGVLEKSVYIFCHK